MRVRTIARKYTSDYILPAVVVRTLEMFAKFFPVLRCVVRRTAASSGREYTFAQRKLLNIIY